MSDKFPISLKHNEAEGLLFEKIKLTISKTIGIVLVTKTYLAHLGFVESYYPNHRSIHSAGNQRLY